MPLSFAAGAERQQPRRSISRRMVRRSAPSAPFLPENRRALREARPTLKSPWRPKLLGMILVLSCDHWILQNANAVNLQADRIARLEEDLWPAEHTDTRRC